jgi:CxxC motif-containing protein (DUF1111 family)
MAKIKVLVGAASWAALTFFPALAQEISPRLGGDGSRPVTADNAFSLPMANMAPSHLRDFSFGNRLFNTNWVDAPASVEAFDGLGPMFNRVSCAGCHTRDGRGEPPEDGQGPMNSMLLRISLPGEGPHGGPLPLPAYGDQLSERALLSVRPEGRARVDYREIPGTYGDGTAYSLRAPTYRIEAPAYGPLPEATMISPRVAPQMIGLGLLAAIPEADLRALSDAGDGNGDGISGEINMVWDASAGLTAPGRFGWKAGQPGLNQQNAGAALGDIGLTSPVFGAENCTAAQAECAAAPNGGSPELSAEFLRKLTLYTMTLAVPEARDWNDPAVQKGLRLFGDMGCASCHTPVQETGTVAGFPELSDQVFHPFTDLLLHDMGPGLADGRPEFGADGQEWRTPPLWGLGLVDTVNGHTNLLHDGRARGFAEAVLWHGGEAEAARENFRLAPAIDRAALISFLNAL